MKPFELEELRVFSTEADGKSEAPSQRLLVEPWLPHQYKWTHVGTIGVVVGILAAFTTFKTGSVFLLFGISAATLVFLNCGVENIPVTHHISLIGSTVVAIYTGDVMVAPLFPSLLLGGLFGLGSALVGEVIQRILYSHAGTHLDPPASAIVIWTFVIAVLAMAGALPSSAWIPLPG